MGAFIRHRNICQNKGSSANAAFNPVRLRWDKADINKYYNFTRTNLEPLWQQVVNVPNLISSPDDIDRCYQTIVRVLQQGPNYLFHTLKELFQNLVG